MSVKSLLFALLILCSSFSIANAAPNYFQQTVGANKTANILIKKQAPQKNMIVGRAWLKFLALQRKVNRSINLNMNKLKHGQTSALFLLLGLGFIYGIVHSLGPGHGKLLIISYFSGTKANWKKGVLMGFQIAFTHVISAIILVLTVKGVAEYALYANEQKQIKIIQIISYALITLLGVYMLVSKFKQGKKGEAHEHTCSSCSKLFAISIGLTPCVGSLLVLLYAMAHQQLWTGLLVVLATALGIALTLSAIGVLSIFIQTKMIEKSTSPYLKKCSEIFGYIGAVGVTFLGAILLYKTIV